MAPNLTPNLMMKIEMKTGKKLPITSSCLQNIYNELDVFKKVLLVAILSLMNI